MFLPLLLLHSLGPMPPGTCDCSFRSTPTDRSWSAGARSTSSRGGEAERPSSWTTRPVTVLAAFSQTAFRLDQFATSGHWHYSALDDQSVRADPEAGLMGLIQRMQDSDVVGPGLRRVLVRAESGRRFAIRPTLVRSGAVASLS